MKIAYDPKFLEDAIREEWFPIFQEILKGHEVVLTEQGAEPDPEVKGMIAFNLFEDPLKKFPNLEHIFALVHGVNAFVKSTYLDERLTLYRLIDKGLIQAMREYVMSMILRLHIDHEVYEKDQKNKEWHGHHYTPPLASTRRIGFLGAGQLGSACAQDAVYMGFPVSCWSRSEKYIHGVTSYFGTDQFDKFLSESDILVILAPLTPETYNLLDKTRLSQLPEGASIINAGRGPLIVDEDLLELLDSGHIDRAILDVFRKEPLPEDHPYWTHPDVLMTPHISAITHPTTSAEHIFEVVTSIENGDTPPGMVDLQLGY